MKINFDKNFYSAKAVNSSIETFKELANFRLKKDKRFFTVFLEPALKANVFLLKDEFSNFVLFESLKNSQS